MRKWLGSAVYVMKQVSLSILRHTLVTKKNGDARLRDPESRMPSAWPRNRGEFTQPRAHYEIIPVVLVGEVLDALKVE